MGSENRQSGRRRTLFGGVIFDQNDRKWECSISNLSETGAMVRTKAVLEKGMFVELKINKFNDLRRAEVMRVGDGEIGLRFLVKVSKNKNKNGMADLLRPVKI